MNYTIEEKFNCVIIELKGKILGGPHAETFREELHELIEKGMTNVIADLSKVSFMNSSGLGILIGAMTTMKNADGQLVICGADQKIENLLMVTQLLKVFEHYRTREEAIQAFQQTEA